MRTMKRWIIFPWIIFSSISLMHPLAPLASGEKGDLEVTVKGVDLNPRGESSMVVLVDLKGEMALPIMIGFSEARAIGLKVNNIKTLRPMTHDLINTIFDQVKVKLLRILINKVEESIIYAVLYLKLDGTEIQVDSRPSDAIAIALRAGAPIFVSARENRFVMGEGLTVQRMTALLGKHFGLESPQGVLVADVKPGSPAERAGLRIGDVIIEINGQRIQSLEGFKSMVHDIGEGEGIKLRVQRGADLIPLVLHP
jgi:bifunctional DNase/RNase